MAVGAEDVSLVLERLEATLGRSEYAPRFDPLSELVSCILSQHTTDATSYPTFDRLRARYPSWGQLYEAGESALSDAIRAAGLANQKAKSIMGCLRAICEHFGSFTLDPLRQMSDEDAKGFLEKLPGVGPKTAAIVLCFALGRDVIPVDTHVFRVSHRLGWIDKKRGEAKAHTDLAAILPAGAAYRLHMALIQHGRSTCRAQRPACGACVLADLCLWARSPQSGLSSHLPEEPEPGRSNSSGDMRGSR